MLQKFSIQKIISHVYYINREKGSLLTERIIKSQLNSNIAQAIFPCNKFPQLLLCATICQFSALVIHFVPFCASNSCFPGSHWRIPRSRPTCLWVCRYMCKKQFSQQRLVFQLWLNQRLTSNVQIYLNANISPPLRFSTSTQQFSF